MKYHNLTIAGLKYQMLSSSVVLYLCLHTSATVVLTADRLTGTIIHMSFKINTHESWPLHETNEAADPLDSLMTWLLLNATCMTGGIHLLNHHSSHPLLHVHITAQRDQIHIYIIHLGWLSWHTKMSRAKHEHILDLWDTFVKVLESYKC